MRRRKGGTSALGLGLVALMARELPAQRVWQADLQVQSIDIALLNANLVTRVVVLTDLDEARAVRVEILVPVGVGIVRMAPGCTASAAPPGVSALRARVTCELGNLPIHGTREVFVMTTLPPTGIRRAFGAFAMSDTPDPVPANNFAERTLP
jgi:hypothetical protein